MLLCQQTHKARSIIAWSQLNHPSLAKQSTVYVKQRVNTTGMPGHISGNIWSAGDEMSYPPKFVKTVIKFSAEQMRAVQPVFVVQARHRDSPRESDSSYFA